MSFVVSDDSPDLSQLSALQRLSLENRAKKASLNKGSLAALARKPAASSPLATSPPSTPSPKTSSLAAIAAKRRLAGDGAVKSPSSPIGPASPSEVPSSKVGPKPSKLAQKIKLAGSASQQHVAQESKPAPASDESSNAARSTEPRATTPGSPTAIFPLAGHTHSVPLLSIESVDPPSIAKASPFGSLLANDWKPVTIQAMAPPVSLKSHNGPFFFDSPSPDDIVEAKRVGTRLGKAVKERGGP